MDSVIAEILLDVTAPRKLATLAHLKTLGEILKYLITLRVHESKTSFEFRIINAVLHPSQHIYAFPDEGLKKKILMI